MDVRAHFESLTRELEALRDRVRNFSVATPHWQTDGEWKESVLRAVLRAYLPAHIEPLRGFVVTPERGTGQIDVLLYDNRKPVLFRNGDLVFVTPDAVVGIIEVKSRIRDRTGLREALISLSDDAELIRSASYTNRELFVGLFAYQTSLSASRHREVLEDLQTVAEGNRHRIASYICLGCSLFCMFWENPPDSPEGTGYDMWHSYNLPDLAPGYFINNLVSTISSDSVENNIGIWFPARSKELQKLGEEAFRPHNSANRANGKRRRRSSA